MSSPSRPAKCPARPCCGCWRKTTRWARRFFAYIPATRRFVLERVIDNEEITTASFKEDMLDLARLVIDTQAIWSVSEWKNSGASPGDSKDAAKADAPSMLTGSTSDAKPIKSAAGELANEKEMTTTRR